MPLLRSAWCVLLLLAGCCAGGGAGHPSVGTLALDPLAAEGVTDAAAIEALMATEVLVIQSWQVRERAVQRLALFEPLGADEMDAVEGLGSAMTVTRLEGSTVLEVSVTTPDPEVSTAACNAVLEAYLDHRLEQRMAPLQQQQAWLGDQVRQLEQELADPAMLDPEVRARRQWLLEEMVERLTGAELEQASMINDARILDRCSLPGAAP